MRSAGEMDQADAELRQTICKVVMIVRMMMMMMIGKMMWMMVGMMVMMIMSMIRIIRD